MFEDRNKKKTEISELGEFGLIEHLTKNIKIENTSTIKGVGDDAAVIDNKNKQTLVSSDFLIEGVDFDLTYTPLKHLGYKAAIINFSDIIAMNGIPQQLIVNIAFSNRFTLQAIDEIYKGIFLACEKYNVDLVGGDTSTSVTGLILSMTVIGSADKEKITYRNTAKENNIICVTGDLGAAYMGLLLLEREKSVFEANSDMQPDLEGNDYILERFLKPEARLDIIETFKTLDILPTSMIDISDGLASEIIHLCKASNVGCNLYEEKIPIDQTAYNASMEYKINPTTSALNGGGDYEILFTIKQKDYEMLKHNPNITFIGYITEKASGINLITNGGGQVPITAQGWGKDK